MPVVKRTVALHPIMESYVRKLQSIMIDKGWNATYSTALNWMILYSALDVAERRIHPKVGEILHNFLEDRKTIKQIQREDRMSAYVEASKRQIRERYIT
jgi:hypothetical protein